METLNKLSVRGRFAKSLISVGVVLLTCIAYFVAVYVHYGSSYRSVCALLFSREMLLSFLFIAIIWSFAESILKLNEVYRSRPYSYILVLHIIEGAVGVSVFLMAISILGLPNYGRSVTLLFCTLSVSFSFFAKVMFYHALRTMRRKGRNMRNVVFVCDSSGERLIALIRRHFEWGYRIVGIIGDDYMVRKFENVLPVYPIGSVDIESVLSQKVDDLIYARKQLDSNDITHVQDICSDLGITFRLCSSFLNRMSSNAYVRYFDTTPVITVSDLPSNYPELLVKRFVDIVFSLCVIVCGFPFFAVIALLIKLDSPGPVFFRQKRSGLRGREFGVFKFRTMVVNAEALQKDLMAKNEMSGPVFKMTDDPRITRVGKLLRKTGVDEFPQFLNVFIGDMSIVGPRPPLPKEVAQYDRWQMRRLAMKPGITCIWQVAPNRNNISFEDWVKMDMEYIDNWSLTLDFVLILKTVGTIFRADGK
ncbi:MAG: sugar transferase [Bacteroidales bacterium]|nr:sugar transferase [Bacteroidales bacterium]